MPLSVNAYKLYFSQQNAPEFDNFCVFINASKNTSHKDKQQDHLQV